MPKRRSRYGRAIIGDAEFERQRKVHAETRGIYGPAVTGKPKDSETPAELHPGEVEESDGQMSIRDLEKLLDESPELLDRQIEAEFMRPDVRKGAVRLFIGLERAQGSPRDHVLEFLEAFLTQGS